MIKKLMIKNVAIIEDLTVLFDSGLNILTGKTGAGKSIIINSISYLLGSKFNKNLIKSNCTEALLSFSFLFPSIPTSIKRHFYINSASKSYINNIKVTLKELIYKSKSFVDMHGFLHEEAKNFIAFSYQD